MKILSNGNLAFTGTCTKCGCKFELPFSEIKTEKTFIRTSKKRGSYPVYYSECPQCTFGAVSLSQCPATPQPIMDADEPITAQELYDFLQSFNPQSHLYLYINGEKCSVMEMLDDEGDLILITDKFNERPNES